MKQQKSNFKIKLAFMIVLLISPIYILFAEFNANFNVNDIQENKNNFLNDNEDSNSEIKKEKQLLEINKKQKQIQQTKQNYQIESESRLLQENRFLEEYLKFNINTELKIEFEQTKKRIKEQNKERITFEEELKNITLYFDELYDIIYLQEPITGLYVTKIQSQLYLCHKLENYEGYTNQQFTLEKDEADNDYIRLAIPSSSNIQQYWGLNGLQNDQVFLFANRSNFTKWKISHNHQSGLFKFNFNGQVLNSWQLAIVVQTELKDLNWLNPYQDLVYIQSKEVHPLFNNIYYNSTLMFNQCQNIILQFIIHFYDTLPNHLVFLNAHLNIHPSIIVAIENAHQVESVQPIGLFCLDNRYPSILDLSFNILNTHYGLFYTKYKQDFIHYNYNMSDFKLQDSYDYIIKQIKPNQEKLQSVFLLVLQECGAKIKKSQSWFYTSCDSSFIVSKKAVQKIPKSFYQCLLGLQQKDLKQNQNNFYNIVLKDIWLLLFEYEQLFEIEF